MRGRHADRDSFLQEQLCRLDGWVGVETSLDEIFLQDVCERNETHALVVSHERSDQHGSLTFR